MSDRIQRPDSDMPARTPLCTAVILAGWRAALADCDPWFQMPNDDVLGEMRRVIGTVIRVLRDPSNRDSHTWLIKSAGDHGAYRRAQRCELSSLAFEFDVLMDVLESAVWSECLSTRSAAIALSILSEELHSAALASARGWASVARSM